MDSFDSRNLRRILKIRWQDKVRTLVPHKRKDRPVPTQHHTSEKTSDLVRTPDLHESGEATKAGHELEDARQQRTRPTTDDLEANHLTRPQQPGHVIQRGRSCSTGPDRMAEETVRLMRHLAQEDIRGLPEHRRPP